MVSISSFAFFSSYINISGVPEYSIRLSMPCACAAAPPIPILESPSSSTEPFLAPPAAAPMVLMAAEGCCGPTFALPGRTFGPFLLIPDTAWAPLKAGGLALLAARLAFDPPTTILAVFRVLEPGTLLYYEAPVPLPLPVVPFCLIYLNKDLQSINY